MQREIKYLHILYTARTSNTSILIETTPYILIYYYKKIPNRNLKTHARIDTFSYITR